MSSFSKSICLLRPANSVAFLAVLVILNCAMGGVEARSVEDLRVMRPSRSNEGDPGVSVISKHTWLEQGLKPMPTSYYRKKTKKVDTQKFRQCIFFQLCSKSECFHYGRYSKCS